MRVLAFTALAVGVFVRPAWHFLVREGITFKKKPARQRAGSARRGEAARAMEALPRPA